MIPYPTLSGTMFPIADNKKYCSDQDSHYTDTWKAMEEVLDKGLCR